MGRRKCQEEFIGGGKCWRSLKDKREGKGSRREEVQRSKWSQGQGYLKVTLEMCMSLKKVHLVLLLFVHFLKHPSIIENNNIEHELLIIIGLDVYFISLEFYFQLWY